MTETRLYLLRHGQAEGSDDTDPGLTATGREQATRAAATLEELPLTGILHSPQRRAVQTAQLIAAELNLAATESEHLKDRTPFPDQDEWQRYPQRYHDWLRETPDQERDPGGRQLDRAIDTLSNSGQHLLLITHAFVIGWFVRDALDAPSWRWLGLQPDNCSLSIISYGKDKRLHAFNRNP